MRVMIQTSPFRGRSGAHFRVAAACILSLALAAASAEAQDADGWLQKATAPFGQAPFQLTFTVKLRLEQAGTQVEMDGQGTFLYLDDRHSVSQQQTTTRAGGMTQEATSHTIADGEHSWAFSTAQGDERPKQILRSSLDELQARAASEGTVLSVSGDPLSQLRTLAPHADLEVVRTEGDDVVLEGGFREDLPDSMKGPLQMFGNAPVLTLRVDQATGEPQAMQIGPRGAPTLDVTFGPIEYLEKANVQPESFAFQPPMNVPIFSP